MCVINIETVYTMRILLTDSETERDMVWKLESPARKFLLLVFWDRMGGMNGDSSVFSVS
jgi:hypothetical protein